jgi:glycine cleavage system H protein
MVVVLMVLLTFGVFLLVDWYRIHKREAAGVPVAGAAAPVSSGARSSLPATEALFFHPGHTWVRVAPEGQVAVGVSEFASNFVGRLKDVLVPREGQRLRQGETAWTLVSQRGRRLRQVMPVDGTVVAVNAELDGSPMLIQESPYEKGWLLRVKPDRLGESLSNLMHGLAAKTWLDSSRTAMSSRLGAGLGVLALDGGEWVPAFGDLLEDEDWKSLEAELFPSES